MKQPHVLQPIAIDRLRGLKLPPPEAAHVQSIAAEAKAARGLPRQGVLLFVGERGPIAAQALAKETGHDLFRIDLAAVVSKHIGDTEKNLRRVFEQAGDGAILLFDEADALFGKRTEVKDSHDRYANIEVAYLLQAIETSGGLAVLVSRTQRPLAAAVKRRLRVYEFPPKA